MELTPLFIKEYARQNGYRYPQYDETVKIANRLKPHACGNIELLAEHLIRERRPSELEETFNYRKKIAVRKTKGTIDKIFNCLCKIRKSPDWNIKYDTEYYQSKPALSEFNLKEYCEELLPRHQSVTNWVFNYLLKVQMYDANAVILIAPMEVPQDESQYLQPIPIVFESCHVYDFSDKLFVGLSTEKSTYLSGKIQMTDGKVFWVATPTEVYKFSQKNAKNEYDITLYYNHNIGELPAFRVGGQIVDEQNMIHESMFDALQSYLDEIVREHSDLQVEVLNHVHSVQWQYETQSCGKCNGTGKVIKGSRSVTCTDCNGGKLSTSPMKRVIISAPEIGQQAAPTPPMGYIQKDTSIVKLQDERIRNHEYDALACFNMEYLAKVPAVESGVAKTLDREELTTFVNLIAEQLVQAMDLVYYFINEYLFNIMFPVPEERQKQLPEIAVPEQFDLLNSQYYINEIQTAINAKVNPVVIRELQLEYAQKKFRDDDVYDDLECVFKLDPLSALSLEEKTIAAQQRWVSDFDLIKSTNIYQFVKQAKQENDEFDDLPYDEQEVIINKLTADYITNMDAVSGTIDANNADSANSMNQNIDNANGNDTGDAIL